MSDAWIGFSGSIVGGLFVLVGVILSQCFTRCNYNKSVEPKLIGEMIATRQFDRDALIHIDIVEQNSDYQKLEFGICIENIGLGMAKDIIFEKFILLDVPAIKAYPNSSFGKQPFEIVERSTFNLSILIVYNTTVPSIKARIDSLSNSNQYEQTIKSKFQFTIRYKNIYGNARKIKAVGNVIIQRENPNLEETVRDGINIVGLELKSRNKRFFFYDTEQ